MDRVNSSFRIYDGTGNVIFTTIPDAHSDSASSLPWGTEVGTFVFAVIPPNPSNFYSVHIEGKSQGVPTWAILDCSQ